MSPPTRSLVLVAVAVVVLAPIVGSAAAGGEIADTATVDAQESTVTLTVVVTTPGGDQVKDAILTASWSNGSATATTASNGRAFVDVPAGATVEIRVEHPDYVRNEPFLVSDAEAETVAITVRRRGSLTFLVEDSEGDPVGDARIVLRADGNVIANGRTNAKGGFTTGVIERRGYSVTVVKSGYYRVIRDVTVNKSSRETVSLEEGSVTVSFAVTDDHFDPPKPVSGAKLTLETAGTFTTLQNGEATAQVPVNAVLDLRVTKEGYETVTQTLAVEESSVSVNLSISRTPALNLTAVNERVLVGERNVVSVVDAYGDPVAVARILVDGDPVGTTGGDGTLTFRIDSPGEHVVVAKADGRTSGNLTIRVVKEQTATSTPTQTPTATRSPTPGTETSPMTERTTGAEVDIPGFTPVTFVVAMVALAAMLARRARRPGE